MNSTAHDPSMPHPAFGLWVGMIGPPLLWLFQFQVRYSFAGAPPGSARHYVIIATAVVALVLLAASCIWSRRVWRLAAAGSLDRMAGVRGRIRFMALLGMMSSALFFLVTVAQTLAHLFLLPGKA